MARTAMTGQRTTTSTSVASTGTPPVSTVTLNEVENPSLQLIVHKPNGNNYLEWAQSIKLMIDGKGKLGHLIGKTTKLADNDPTLKTWRSENSLVIAWLVNSTEPAIGMTYLVLPITKEVWEAVQETYSDLENSFQICKLKTKLCHSKQENQEVTEYYNEMKAL